MRIDYYDVEYFPSHNMNGKNVKSDEGWEIENQYHLFWSCGKRNM